MGTENVAEFIAGISYERIPEQAVKIAKRCIIDTLGVALAGSRESEGEIITEFCKESGGRPAASIITSGFKTSAPLAALANGTMAHALDYDDISNKSLGHPSAVLVPVVLALAEDRRLSGKHVLTSFVTGFEIATRVGDAMGVRFFESNWHPTPIVGSLAAAAAATRILGLDVQQSKMALGIVSSLAGGLKRNFGTMTKPLHAGSTAHNGVIAALLASKNFTANQSILEDKNGVCSTFAVECEISDIGEGLGETWDILTEVRMKVYPCCGGSHGSIDAILELRKKHNLSPEEVGEIECRVSPTVSRMLIYHSPQTVQESRFSLEYAVAIALLDGAVSLKQFHEKKLASPLTQRLISKVRCSYLEDLGHGLDLPHEVVVSLINGNECSCKVEKYKGTPDNPLSDSEVSSKFADCASLVLKTKDIDRALDLMWHMEELADITELMKILAIIKT